MLSELNTSVENFSWQFSIKSIQKIMLHTSVWNANRICFHLFILSNHFSMLHLFKLLFPSLNMPVELFHIWKMFFLTTVNRRRINQIPSLVNTRCVYVLTFYTLKNREILNNLYLCNSFESLICVCLLKASSAIRESWLLII